VNVNKKKNKKKILYKTNNIENKRKSISLLLKGQSELSMGYKYKCSV
jgi:hypothetical protein